PWVREVGVHHRVVVELVEDWEPVIPAQPQVQSEVGPHLEIVLEEAGEIAPSRRQRVAVVEPVAGAVSGAQQEGGKGVSRKSSLLRRWDRWVQRIIGRKTSLTIGEVPAAAARRIAKIETGPAHIASKLEIMLPL